MLPDPGNNSWRDKVDPLQPGYRLGSFDASGVTLMIGEMKAIWPKRYCCESPVEAADAIRSSRQVSILAGAIKARMMEVAELTLKNPSQCSNIRISSVLIDCRPSIAKDTVITQTSGCGPQGHTSEVPFDMRPAIIPRAVAP